MRMMIGFGLALATTFAGLEGVNRYRSQEPVAVTDGSQNTGTLTRSAGAVITTVAAADGQSQRPVATPLDAPRAAPIDPIVPPTPQVRSTARATDKAARATKVRKGKLVCSKAQTLDVAKGKCVAKKRVRP